MDDRARFQRLSDLYEAVRRDSTYRTEAMGDTFVPGSGAPTDNLLVLVGEAPGREEEKALEPFVGAAGRNLNTLLSEIGLSRRSVFITNVVKYRPLTPAGGNRTPSLSERRRALPYLLRELEILSPRLVVCLGLSPARTLLGMENLKMSEANARFFYGERFKILVAYHPSPYNFMVEKKRAAMRAAFRLAQAHTGGNPIPARSS